MKKEQQWRRWSGAPVYQPIEHEILKTLEYETSIGNELRVCIGTDSQVKGDVTHFATVIVFIRKGKGGFMFVNNETTLRKMGVKERMLLEVAKSIDVAYPLCGTFSRYNVELEIHADINTSPFFKSNDALREAMGYILGMGFAFKAKPLAFASSQCADRAVH